MKLILVIGNCGAGKSTLAQFLAMRLHLPLISLDKLWWLPGWQQDTRENFARKLAAVLKQDEWIIDGNYNRTMSERLKYADYVIFPGFSPAALPGADAQADYSLAWKDTSRYGRWLPGTF